MDQQPSPTNNSDRWPGAFGVFKPSLRTVAFNLLPFVITIVLSFVFSGILSLVIGRIEPGPMTFLLNLVSYVVSFLFSLVITIVLLDSSESKKVELGNAFERSLSLFFPYVGLVLLTGLVALVSLLLFIVPFFFVFPRIALASYYLVDKKMGVIDSFKASWNETKGHVGKVYGIIGVNILMVLPVFTLIGIPVSIFLLVAYSAATVILYKFMVTGQLKDPVQEPIETPVPTA